MRKVTASTVLRLLREWTLHLAELLTILKFGFGGLRPMLDVTYLKEGPASTVLLLFREEGEEAGLLYAG